MSEQEPNEIDQSNRAALATPGAITLRGETFHLSPFTPADFGQLLDYTRNLALADVQTPLQALAKDFENLPPLMQAAAMREAIAQASGAKTPEPTREALAAKASTLEGIRYSFWLSARKLHPGLALERVTELVQEEDRYTVMEKQLEVEGQKAKGEAVPPKAPGPVGS